MQATASDGRRGEIAVGWAVVAVLVAPVALTVMLGLEHLERRMLGPGPPPHPTRR